MNFLINYVKSFFLKIRYKKTISFLAFWDLKTTNLNENILLSPFVRLSSCRLGKYTRVRHFSTIYHAEIGNYCSISSSVKIGLGIHPINLISTNSIFYKINSNPIRKDFYSKIEIEEYKKTKIGNDVWIGEGVTIPGGITIGDGAVIAAKSVVTKDVPPYAIVAGVPAKIVKYRFDENIIKELLIIKWWNFNDERIKKNINIFIKENLTLEDLKKIL